MNTYFAVVNKEHDSAYGLWFPDVEGCFSAADREEDIISNAIEALLLHLEDEEQPHARQSRVTLQLLKNSRPAHILLQCHS